MGYGDSWLLLVPRPIDLDDLDADRSTITRSSSPRSARRSSFASLTQSGIAPGIYNEPDQHWESAASKRRFKNLLDVSGLTDKLHLLRPRKATEAEAEYYHTKPYLEKVKEMSEIGFGDAGELTPVGKGSWEIALLSAGGCITGVDAVLDGKVDNAYILNRPPGHHAEADRGRGFCICECERSERGSGAKRPTLATDAASEPCLDETNPFRGVPVNNVVIAAEHARKARGLKRVAIIDWDVGPG